MDLLTQLSLILSVLDDNDDLLNRHSLAENAKLLDRLLDAANTVLCKIQDVAPNDSPELHLVANLEELMDEATGNAEMLTRRYDWIEMGTWLVEHGVSTTGFEDSTNGEIDINVLHGPEDEDADHLYNAA